MTKCSRRPGQCHLMSLHQNCVGGSCVPFDPEKPLIPTYGSNGNSPSRGTSQRNGTSVTKTGNSQVIPDWPEWYDPIFARVFTKLKMTYVIGELCSYPCVQVTFYVSFPLPLQGLREIHLPRQECPGVRGAHEDTEEGSQQLRGVHRHGLVGPEQEVGRHRGPMSSRVWRR